MGVLFIKTGHVRIELVFVLAVVVAGEIRQLLTCSGFAKL